MNESIRTELLVMAEQEFKKFSSALLPGIDNVLGVKLPRLREMAKKIAKGDWRSEITDVEDIYFEETMLRGMIIGYANTTIEETIAYMTAFIPMINNWSVCDSFCVSLKCIMENKEKVWGFIQPYLNSSLEFEVRVGLILLLDYYIKCDESGKKISRQRMVIAQDLENLKEPDGEYIDRVLEVLNREYLQGYYAQMAAAWTMAEAFCTFPSKTFAILQNSQMDDFTYKKTLQKICESRTPSDEVKQIIRGMHRHA